MPPDDVDVVTTPIDYDWLALRNWARHTLSAARAHAAAYPEVGPALRGLEPQLVALIAACAWREMPLEARLAQLEKQVAAHVEDDARG